MKIRIRAASFITHSTCLFVVIGCSKGDTASGSAAGSNAATTTEIATTSSVQTQPANPDPCGWMTQAEVELITGPLTRAPFRNHGTEAMRPDDKGDACAYVVPSANNSTLPSGIYVEVATHDGTQLTSGVMGALRGVGNWLPPGYSLADTGVAGPWDEAAGSGKRLFVARQGDAAVVLTGLGWGLPKDQLGALAAKLLAKIPDQPSQAPPPRRDAGDDEALPGDPCSFVTAAEAEQVLGKLTVPPYRSRTTTSMASAEGGSCSYRTAKHRVFVLSPTWTGGKDQLKMAAITGQQTAKILGGTAEADTLEGPWDQVAGGPSGEIYFLKGDALIAMQYASSSTDVAGAATLARKALGRF